MQEQFSDASPVHDIGRGITCIDADYLEQGRACFYLLRGGKDYAVIDSGTLHSTANLFDLLQQRDIDPHQVRYVIPTHVHLDHAGGAGELMRRLPAATLLVHPRGAKHMIDPAKLVDSTIGVYGRAFFERVYGEVVPVPRARVIEVEDGHTLALGSRQLVLRHTPGHADHHICIWDEQTRGWFSGDCCGVSYNLMQKGANRYVLPTTTPPQFRPEALVRTVELLRSYAPERAYLTHFGAVDFTAGVAAQLIGQIRAYAALPDSLAGDTEAIGQAILRITEEWVSDALPGTCSRELLDTVADDLALNAQGISVFLQRRLADVSQ